MVADSVHGAEVAHTCVALLTPAFASRFEAKPEALAAFVSKAHKCSGGREWSDATRRGLGVHVSELVGRLLDEPPAADDGAAAARWAQYQAPVRRVVEGQRGHGAVERGLQAKESTFDAHSSSNAQQFATQAKSTEQAVVSPAQIPG